MELRKRTAKNRPQSEFWLHRMMEDAKNHLSSISKYNYVFNAREITESQMHRIKEHLQDCKECREEIKSLEDKKHIQKNFPDLEY